MLKKSTVLFILIVCKSTVTFAGYGSAENRALNLIPLVFFYSIYTSSDLLISYPIGKGGEKQEDVRKSKESNKGGSSDSSSTIGRATGTQGSLQNQHTDDEGDDEPPLPPEDDKKEPYGAECLPFPLQKVVQAGEAPISFTFQVKKEDLLVNSGNSSWYRMTLTQGSGFLQISLHWYWKDRKGLSLWPIARTSEPLPDSTVVFLGDLEEDPGSSSDFIHLTGELPSDSQSILSELNVEVQLLDDNDQVLSNVFFSMFNSYDYLLQATYPLGLNGLDMFNHQSNIHKSFYNPFARIADPTPFPDCDQCNSIADAMRSYQRWLDFINEYVKDHEALKLRVIIKSKEQ